MKNKEIKEKAQFQLMSAMQVAFNQVEDLYKCEYGKDYEKIVNEMSNQMKRVEKLFGYEENSWNRGC